MLTHAILAAALQAGGPTLVNTGMDTNPSWLVWQNGPKTAFASPSDSELYVFDAETQELFSTELPVPGGSYLRGRLILFLVDEALIGEDLDGDGNTDHLIYHVLDLATNGVQSLGIPGVNVIPYVFGSRVHSPYIGLVVPEADAGDLNGDGDSTDLIAHVFDSVTGEVRDLGLAVSDPPIVEGDRMFVRVSEFAQGQEDLNGDGQLSWLLFRHDFLTNTTQSTDFTGWKGAPGLAFQDQSVSGVGTYFELDDEAGATTLGVGFQFLYWASARGFTALQVTESTIGNGVDLNGDGDLFDDTVLGYFPRSGRLKRLGLEGTTGFFWAHEEGGQFSVISGIREDFEQVDVTGDGDTLDVFVRYWNSETGVTTLPLAVDGMFPWGAGSLTAFGFDEQEQGVDLDGDGQISGTVDVVHDFARNQTWVLPWSTWSRLLSGRIYYAIRSEFFEGVDLTGDGEQDDLVLSALDTETGVETTFPYSIASLPGLNDSNGYLAIAVREDGVDLNGDGDADDDVLHVVVP